MLTKKRWALAAAAAWALAVSAGPAMAQELTARATEGPQNNPAEFVGRMAVNYPMLQVAIENRGQTESLQMRSATLTASGTGDETAAILANGVELYHDADANGEADTEAGDTLLGSATSFSADNGTVSFNFAGAPVEIAPGATEHLLCVYNLNGSAAPGQTFKLDLASSGDLGIFGSTGGAPATLNGPPVAGLEKQVGQGKLLLNALPDLTNTPEAFYPTFAYNSAIRFKIDNTFDERVELLGLDVRVTGDADDAAIIVEDGVRLQFVDDNDLPIQDEAGIVATASISGNNGTASLVLDEPLEIPRGAVLYAYVLIETNVVLEQYFNEMLFTIVPGSVAANGLDSLATGLEVLGQGLAGPARQYRGTEIEADIRSQDLGDAFVTPGSSDYPVLSFTMKVEKPNLETVTLDSITFGSIGTLNEMAEVESATLWLDTGNRQGRVDRDGAPGVTMADTQLGQSMQFTIDDGEITFSGLALVLNQSNQNFLLSFDISDQAMDGRDFQVFSPGPLSVSGIGEVTLAPPLITDQDLQGGLRTVLRNEFALREDVSGEPERRDRKAFPRRGGFDADMNPDNSLTAWNFMLDVSDNEPVFVEEVSIQVTGTLDDPSSLVSARFGLDSNRDGMYGNNEFLVAELTNLAALGPDPLLTFTVAGGSDPIEFDAGDSQRLELYLTLNGGPETIGSNIQFEVADMKLRGSFSQALATRATDPFASVVKPIIIPRAAVTTSNSVDVDDGRFQCVNAPQEFSTFNLKPDMPSENFMLTGVEFASTMSGANLSQFSPQAEVWHSMNTDDDILEDDTFLGFMDLDASGHAFVEVPFILTEDTVELTTMEFFKPNGRNYVTAVDLTTPTPVAVDGSIRIFSNVTALHGVGLDSGDPVSFDVLPDSAAFNGFIAGDLGPSPDNFREVFAAPGATGIQAWHTSLGISGTEDLDIENFTLKITKSEGLDLLQVFDPNVTSAEEPGAIYLGHNIVSEQVRLISDFQDSLGVFDPVTETVTFSPSSAAFFYPATAGGTNFNQLGAYMNILPTAPEGAYVEFQLLSDQDLRFRSGGCSLVDSSLIEHRFQNLEPFPRSTDRVFFQTEGLRFDLQKPNDDLPWSAFPDLAELYPVSRLRVRTINSPEIETVRFESLTLHVEGTADDVDALESIALCMGNESSPTVMSMGVFDADDGTVTFSDFPTEFIATRQNQNLFICLTGSAATKAGQNDGQTLNFSFDSVDIGSRGVASDFPTRNFFVDYDGVSGEDELPMLLPEVRIGAGRLFTQASQSVDDFFTVSDGVDVATLAFQLKPDRSENAELEEIVFSLAGTMIDPDAVDGAVIRIYRDVGGVGVVNPTGANADILIGLAPISGDDGFARARFTPPFPLTANQNTRFLAAVDLNGVGADFEDFRHSLIGMEAITVSGELSFPSPSASEPDLLDPHYGTDKAIEPDLGLLDGPLITLGKATLDFDQTNDLPDPDPENPFFILPDQDNVPMLSFEFEALEIEDMKALSFAFIASGEGDESTAIEPQGVRLYRDLDRDGSVDATDVEIGRGSFAADNETLSILLNSELNLVEGDEQQWLLAYNFGENSGLNTTFMASLDLPAETLEPKEDIVGGEGLFSMRPIGVIRTSSGDPFAGPVIQTSSGIVRATKPSTSPSNRDVLPKQADLPLMQVDLRELFNLEPVRLTTMEFNVLPEGISLGNLFLPGSIRLYRDASANGQLDPEDGAPLAVGALSVSAQRITFDLQGIQEVIGQNEQNSYLLVASLDAPLSASGARFTTEISSIAQFAGQGQTTQAPANFRVGGSGVLTSGRFTISAPTAAVSQASESPDEEDAIPPDGTNEVLLGFTLLPSSASDIVLNSIRIDSNGSIDEAAAFAPGSIRLARDNGTSSNVFDPADTVIASGSFPANNGSITFAIPPGPDAQFARSQTAKLWVLGDLNGTAPEGQTVGLVIASPVSISLTAVEGGLGNATPTGTFPIASGPTPLAGLRVSAQPYATQPATIDVIATSEDATLWQAVMAATAVEEVDITGLTFDVSGSGNDVEAFMNAQVRLVDDKNGDGVVNAGDSELAVAAITANDGQAVFSDVSIAIPKGGQRSLLLSADLSGMANLGETFLFTLTAMQAQGADTERTAQAGGLPFAGPLVSIAAASYDFRFPGAESLIGFALADEADFVALTLRMVPSLADDIELQALTFSLDDPADASFIIPGSVRLYVDSNFSGEVEDSDELLSGGATFDGAGQATFPLLAAELPKGEETYLLLACDLSGAGTDGADLRVFVDVGGATAIARTSGLAASPNGLPFFGAPKRLRTPGSRTLLPHLEDFEGGVSTFRPALGWQAVPDPGQARSGSFYMRAFDKTPLLTGADYAMTIAPPIDAAALAGTKRVSLWARSAFPNSAYRGRIQGSTNGGDSWTTLGSIIGESTKWKFFSFGLSTAQAQSDSLLLRVLLDGGTSASGEALLHIDRVVVQGTANVQMRDFEPAPGFTTTITPDTQDYRATIDIRNTRSNPVSLDAFAFRFQAPDGRSLDQFVTVTPIAGVPGAVLGNNQTMSFEYRWDFDESLPGDVFQINVDPFLVATDQGTSTPVYVDSYELGDFTLILVNPSSGVAVR